MAESDKYSKISIIDNFLAKYPWLKIDGERFFCESCKKIFEIDLDSPALGLNTKQYMALYRAKVWHVESFCWKSKSWRKKIKISAKNVDLKMYPNIEILLKKHWLFRNYNGDQNYARMAWNFHDV